MPKVIRSRNLVSVGEVEIPDQVILEVDTTPADADGVNESLRRPLCPSRTMNRNSVEQKSGFAVSWSRCSFRRKRQPRKS